jgi:predicted secreted protein
MKPWSMVAIYFVIWWISLFAILPIGVRNAHEAGEAVGEGHDAGAPVAHGLVKKALINTVVATVIFGAVYWFRTHGYLGG